MSETFKISGKKTPMPKAASQAKLTLRPGGWVLAELPDGSRKRVMLHEAKGKISIALGSLRAYGELTEDRKGGAGAGGGGASDLVAQFPGKVRKILVQAGAQVTEGQPLLLIEAMKMEFAVKAPFAGKVTQVLVKEGQQLSPGDRFIDLQEDTQEAKK